MIHRNHEPILAPNPPRPDQLHQLANIGARSAASRDALKHMHTVKNAHFFVHELDLANDASLLTEVGQMRHRMVGRIGVRRAERGIKLWSLKFYDTYWVETQPTQWQANRTLYTFEWNRVRTTMASRALQVIGDNVQRPPEDLADTLDTLSLRGDEPDIWHAEAQFETVTQGDCEQLIHDATDYFDIVDRLHASAS